MATLGTGTFSCPVVDEVRGTRYATTLEGHDDCVLAPTCNACTPGGAPTTDTRDCLSDTLASPDEAATGPHCPSQ